jgi:predicted RNA-binding protein (virulence factor B family)
MLRIGEYQTLTIKREMPQGFYLVDEEEQEVLLPRGYITSDMRIGDRLEVFVYCDSEDMDVASTEKPLLTVGEFACLRVTDVTHIGAFCDWGMRKDLFIPFSNQVAKLRTNYRAVVHMYLDEKTDRLVGTTKLKKFLKHTADEHISKGQEVDLMVYSETDLGYNVIIDQTYSGLVYENEIHNRLRIGEQLKGYIKPIREDGKIDVSLFPLGFNSIEPGAQTIMEKLKTHQGFLPYTDKSDAADISEEFSMSKKLFKKSLGSLYRQKLVTLKPDGIYLVNKSPIK